ncbi:MAG TPA: MFS transporter, partial [Vicinamibacteria bacterium]|nr:MFS transporter [Vicinamibacteria bacterium]
MSTRPYHALRHREFRRVWLSQLVSQTGSQMQSVALHWHVYLLTGSPLALGFVGLTRALPTILFSLWGGVVADRRDRRAVMLAAQSVMTVGALALAGLTVSHRETLVALYLLNALGAAAGAFDNPSRQALIPRLVPVADLPGALALNLAMFQTAQIAGPALAGLLIAGGARGLLAGPASHAAGAAVAGTAGGTGALALIYGLNALSFLGVLGVLATLTTSGKVEAPAGSHDSPLAALREGLRFVFTTPIMVWTTALDFVATFFAGSMSLLPIVADRVLHVGPAGYGVLVAAPATGALLGALYTSTRSLPARQGRLLLSSVAAYGLATLAFGLSRSYVLTLIALAAVGLADLVSTVIRQTLRQLITPDRLRGRMTSVNMIFFIGGPQLGEVEAGF